MVDNLILLIIHLKKLERENNMNFLNKKIKKLPTREELVQTFPHLNKIFNNNLEYIYNPINDTYITKNGWVRYAEEIIKEQRLIDEIYIIWAGIYIGL